ncbi:MAG: hydrogenase expression/formation protein HypE [Bacteroidetes bacterium]|nr:hydrogenase expression/formation protein HypE [Bacteroidota bacterium]
MNVNHERIILSHGNGGLMMHELIENIFIRHFDNKILREQTDAAILKMDSSTVAFTTDSFVVDPVFFPGGDIGKLAICGTVNDLSVSGAIPLYLSVSFILEEGFPLKDLEKIVLSMKREAQKAKVRIVTGDTKVVDRGKCDKLFINTAGIGTIRKENRPIGSGKRIRTGDKILINGNIGDHGIAVMSARESFNFSTTVVSDCASLNLLIQKILNNCSQVRFMRDPTRGGVATVLNELVRKGNFGIEIDEESLPVSEGVRGMCEILGFDPLYMANEGKVMIVAGARECDKVLSIMKGMKEGRQSAVIGEIVSDHPGKVVLKTITGGKRIIDSLTGEQLPRIC